MAISSNVSEFLQKIRQGVKPNMFKVNLEFPGTLKLTAGDQDLTDLLCKSAALPASNLGVIEVPFRGRTVKIAGDRTFDTWTATFVNDQDMKIRGLFENWLNQINSHEGNTAALVEPSSVTGYMANLKVDQLEKDAVAVDTSANVVRSYTLHHAFPTSVSQIDLAYDSNDQVSEFTVEFQLSYWTANAASGVPAIA
tara:strand:- start:280 stop:867 length:588 start_codon:yes stop_codon:yes gene_type:complete